MIKEYDVEVFSPPCEPGLERYAARAHLAGGHLRDLPQRPTAQRRLSAGGQRAYLEECGEPTCSTSAHKLAAAQTQLAACSPLVELQYAGNLAALEALLIDALAIG